ncbi:B12-binding domain-containing radical SAM protein [Nitrospira lenta]|uniref:Fe-S oxidoreductase-like protein n=1 Tax=Nitrospira lenta TaxID=1436998 RepID=A0A330L7E2_9BACT
MKVLFSNPPWWEGQEIQFAKKIIPVRRWRQGVRAGSRWPFTAVSRSRPGKYSFGDYVPYPFFMGYAATYVAKMAKVEVALRDSIAIKESYEDYYNFVTAGRFDFIFIESATPSFEHDAAVIRKIRKISPMSKIVLAGPIAALGEKLLAEHDIHAVIKGEYEKGSVKVLNGVNGVLDYDLLTEEEMNAAPFPYYDNTIAHQYYDSNPTGHLFPHAQVWASRGCPFKCIFCVWPATMTGDDPDGKGVRRVRYYTPEYMERFLGHLVKTYGYRSIYFDDDTFNLGDRHTREMCDVMKKIGLPWSAMCRADTIRQETWPVMKESGCFGVKLGFESGNQYVVDKIVNKHLDLAEAQATTRYIQSLGMTVHGTFTVGLPGETTKQMQDTLTFIDETKFDTTQVSGTAEIEGTPLSNLRKEGALKSFEGAKMDDNYDRHVDGGKKWQMLVQKLRDN